MSLNVVLISLILQPNDIFSLVPVPEPGSAVIDDF
jgi:hypothetical protein